MQKRKEALSLAFCIALFPPIWAVAAPYVNISTGAVALICAGLYVANGNRLQDALKISVGFLLGDFWAWLALMLMDLAHWNEDLELFVTLFVLGGLAVLISSVLPGLIFCPSWLCGWAIGLTIMAPMGYSNIGTYPVQIAVSMLVGVWYVGALLDKIQRKLMQFGERK